MKDEEIFFREDRRMKVIIAAAGTGGHINPGIAIANKIKLEVLTLIYNIKRDT